MTPGPPGLAVLLGLRLRILDNRLQSLERWDWLKVALMSLLTLGFLGGEGLLAGWLFGAIRTQEDLAALFVLAIVHRLLALAFLVSLFMLFFSNITASLATIYLSRDLELLLATPVPPSRVFLLKLLETLLNSSYMVVLFLLPILVAFGLTFEAAVPYYLLLPPALLVFILPPGAAGILVTMVLMRCLPARRTHQALSAMGVVLAISFVTGLRLMAPERLLRPASTEDLGAILRALTVPATRHLPSSWLADLTLAAVQGAWRSALSPAARLCVLGVVSLAVTWVLARALYFRGVSASREGGRRAPRGPVELGRPLHGSAKDLRLFFRDPTQWTQLLLLLALVIIYVFNITALPQDLLVVGAFLTIRDIIAWLNVGLAGFVLGAIAMRFVLPSVSLEGGAFWVVASSPVDRRAWLLRKLAFYLPGMLTFALTLVALSGHALKVDAYTRNLSLATAALVTATLTTMAVGVGAALPSFKLENPAQFVLTGGGLLYGVLSLLYVVAVVALEARPFFQHLLTSVGRLEPGVANPWPWYAMIVLTSLLGSLGTLAWGLRRLQRIELS